MDTSIYQALAEKSSVDWQKLLSAARQEMARQNPDSLLDWSLAYRFINGQPMELIPALAEIYSDPHPFIVIQKAAQVFCSEYLINTAMWTADTGQGGRGNALYVMPTQTQMNDFSQGRFDRAIAESPYLQQRLYPPPPGKGGPARMQLKRLGQGYIYFRGADNRRQLTSVDAEVVLLDEYDLMGTGVLEAAMMRLASSSLGWMRIASTPRYPEAGINELFLRSDQRYYHLKCPACGRWQSLLWEHNVDTKKFRIVCRREQCRKPLDLWAPGRWIAEAPGNEDIRGYHLNRLYSPLANLQQMVWESQETTPAAQQEFQNSVLGITFVPPGGRLTLDRLDRCRGDYNMPSASKAQTFMGVDVGNMLHVVIREPLDEQRTRSRLVYAGELTSFEELSNLAVTYNVLSAIVDESPDTRGAHGFCRGKHHYAVCRYTRSAPGLDGSWEGGVGICNTNRTQMLEEVFAAFEEKRAMLPAEARLLGGRVRDGLGEYYREMMALTRELEQDANGNWQSRYRDHNKPDHYAHAEAYCHLALRNYRPRPRIRAFSG